MKMMKKMMLMMMMMMMMKKKIMMKKKKKMMMKKTMMMMKRWNFSKIHFFHFLFFFYFFQFFQFFFFNFFSKTLELSTALYSSRTLGMEKRYFLSIEGSILSWWKCDVDGALDPWSCFFIQISNLSVLE